MINYLRKRLIFFTMIALTSVMTVIFGAINIVNIARLYDRADTLISIIAHNGGVVPGFAGERNADYPQFNEETEFETRYFTVSLDVNNNPTEINTGHIASVSEVDAAAYAHDIAVHGKKRGFKGIYRYGVSNTAGGKQVVFLNFRAQQQQIISLMMITGSVGLISLAVIMLILLGVSKRVIYPMAENFRKQKQFITDAGHELKTPLAIISANTEVLEMLNGSSEWTQSIKNQTERLDKLVKNLLQMAKMEESGEKIIFCRFNMSEAVKEAVMPFGTMAKQKNKTFATAIQPELMLNGDENGIKTLVSVLTDNAIKYADDGGKVNVSLEKQGKNIVLKVTNTSSGSENENLGRLFDRFYRADSSRSRETGGYGIGLSIAKTITERNKGKISAERINGEICFCAVFPDTN